MGTLDIEYDRVVAQFMGIINIKEVRPDLGFNYDIWQTGVFELGDLIRGKKQSPLDPHYACVDKLEYHSSWDWFMPVWNKFKSLTFESTRHEFEHSMYRTKIGHEIAYSTLADAHKILVQGIEWYNNLNLKQK